MENCPKCGAQFPANKFVCDYCGLVWVERAKSADSNHAAYSFEESMDIIENNLDMLSSIRRPTWGSGLGQGLRIVLAIYTFGIILIFWKRRNSRFDRENYNSLKTLIERNIKLLKVSSKGSSILNDKILIVEEQLRDVDRKIKTSLLTKTISASAILLLFVLLIIFNGMKNDGKPQNTETNAIYSVFPKDTLIEGALKDYVMIEKDSFIIKKIANQNGDLHEWELIVAVKILKKLEFAQYTKIKMHLQIADKNGRPVSVVRAYPEDDDLRTIKGHLEKGNLFGEWIRFRVNQFPGSDSDKLPDEIRTFTVQSEIVEDK